MSFWRFSFFIFLGFLLVAFNTGFLVFLPPPFYNLNLILVVLIFLLFLDVKFFTLLMISLWIGFLAETLNFLPFGLFTASLALTLIFTNFLFVYLFTNKTLPALVALGFLSTLIFYLFFFLLQILVSIKTAVFLPAMSRSYFLSLGWELILNIGALILFYLLAKKFNKKLEGYFL